MSKNGLWIVSDEFGMILVCEEYGMVDFQSDMELA